MRRTLRLGDHCLKIGSGATPRGGKEAYLAEGPYSLIRSQNVLNERFSVGGLAFISQEQADQLSNVEVQPDDVLLNITGDSVARVCQVDPVVLPARVNQHVAIIRPKPEVIDPRFLRYFMVSPEMQAHMLGLAASGATRNALTKGMIEKFEIPAVPLPEQRAIAATLGALDDKIELNRKMNATLEAIARALFRDWFVDFGPTRAKMEGREPYLSPDLWSLFPDRLDAEGKPEGWGRKSFGELLTSSIGGDWGNGEQDAKFTAPMAVIRGTDIPDLVNAGPNRVPLRFANEKKLEKRFLQPGDIVIEVSGGSPTQPTGRSLYFTQSMLNRFSVPVAPTSFCRRFRPITVEWGVVLSQHLLNLYASGGTWEYQNQSTGIANFQTSHFLEAEKVIVPPGEVVSGFFAICAPMLDQMQSMENHYLAQTRDLLLPRLMSGELRVADALSELETA